MPLISSVIEAHRAPTIAVGEVEHHGVENGHCQSVSQVPILRGRGQLLLSYIRVVHRKRRRDLSSKSMDGRTF